MRVIPIDKGPLLMVLETTDEKRKMHICKSDGGEIVLYAENSKKIYSVEELDQLISEPIPSWFIETINKFINARNEMQKYLREKRIDDLLRDEDYNPYMWA